MYVIDNCNKTTDVLKKLLRRSGGQDRKLVMHLSTLELQRRWHDIINRDIFRSYRVIDNKIEIEVIDIRIYNEIG